MSNTISGPGRPNELGGAWERLAEAAGSVQKLAADIGLSARTVQRLAKKPENEVSKATRYVVTTIAKRYGVPSPYKVAL